MQCCIPCIFAHTACGLCGLQCVYVLLDAAFEVAGLVGMDDIPLGELVEHGAYFRQECFGSGLVRRVAQCLHGIAGCLVIISVLKPVRFGLTNPLL
mgnify:FL=1